MIEDDDNGGDDAPQPKPDDEVPPPKIIKIEDTADFGSPYDSLDGKLLVRDDAVAVARLDAASITSEDGDGVLVGQSIAALAYIIGELGERAGEVRVREVAFGGSVDLGFTALEVETNLTGPDSGPRRGAQRLLNALASVDLGVLYRSLAGVDDSVLVRLEELLKLLFENKATLDVQLPASKPKRIVPERSYALYRILREKVVLPPRAFTAAGRLVGAIADTKDFKLRLDEPWRGRRVIEGKFPDGLEVRMEAEDLWNKEVLAAVSYEEIRRGVRPPDYRFRLDDVQAVPRLQFGDSTD